jgi:ABC-type glycerol-3-phosphate transport system substrate-binding protein
MRETRSSRSRRALLTALAPAGLVVAACGARPDGADDSRPVALRPGVTVQALVDIPAPDQPLLDRVVARFPEAVPQAPKVAYTAGPAAEQATKAQAMLAAGTPPDIIQLEGTVASLFIGKGYPRPTRRTPRAGTSTPSCGRRSA